MDDNYYRETTSYTDEDGREVEINRVVYERSDGLGIDYVEQTKIDGYELDITQNIQMGPFMIMAYTIKMKVWSSTFEK